MKTDLISREALKKAFKNKGEALFKLSRVRKIINDAPTVELTEAEIQEVLNKRGMTAVANEYLIALHGKRQRGEWITVNFAPNELNCPEKSRFDFVKCPFCEVIHQGRHNFCSYCGADMREEGDT